MRRLASLLLLLVPSSVQAADLPTRPFVKALPQAVWSWSGFYAGVNSGYGAAGSTIFQAATGNIPQSIAGDTFLGSLDRHYVVSKGGFVGLQGGYNYQVGRAVIGVEADWQWSGQRSGQTCSLYCNFVQTPQNTFLFGLSSSQSWSTTRDVNWFGTARARVGWTPFDGTLLFATAGGAWINFDQTDTFNRTFDPRVGTAPASASARFNSTAFGYALGGGAEYRLWGNWTGKIEYLHIDVAGVSNTGTLTSLPSIGPLSLTTTSGRLKNDIYRLGLNYNFGSREADVVAAPAFETLANSTRFNSWNWTGAYVGTNAGYAVLSDKFQQNITRDIPVLQGSTLPSALTKGGPFGGAQVGYNYQVSRFVFGVEGDWQATDQHASSCGFSCSFRLTGLGPVSNGTSVDQSAKWFATARGRLGWTPFGGVLIYATGGGAWMQIEETDRITSVPAVGFPPAVTSAAFKSIYGGYSFGVGTEMALWGNWTSKIEYLHVDVAGSTNSAVHSAPPTIGPLTLSTQTGRISNDAIRVGLNYSLGRLPIGAN